MNLDCSLEKHNGSFNDKEMCTICSKEFSDSDFFFLKFSEQAGLAHWVSCLEEKGKYTQVKAAKFRHATFMLWDFFVIHIQ